MSAEALRLMCKTQIVHIGSKVLSVNGNGER